MKIPLTQLAASTHFLTDAAIKVRAAWSRTVMRFRRQRKHVSDEWDAAENVYVLSAAKAKYDELYPSQEREEASAAEVARRAAQERLGITRQKYVA